MASISAIDQAETHRPYSELVRRWPVILAALIAIALSNLPAYTLGVLIDPLSKYFRQDRSAIAAWNIFWSLGLIGTAPVVGMLVDRWGARRMLLAAFPIFGLVMLGVGVLTTSLPALYLAAALVGVATATMGTITCGRLIAGAFDRALGTALGLMSVGVGLSAMLGPIFMQRVVDNFGWRWGFGAIALGVVVMWPLVWFLSGSAATARQTIDKVEEPGATLREALRSRAFWLLVPAAFGFGVSVSGAGVNMMSYLTEVGISRASAAAILGGYGIATVAGRVLTGLALDRVRIHVAILMAAALAAFAVSFLALCFGPTSLAIVFLGLFGFAVGAETDCLAYCTVKLFGRRAYGSIYGLLGVGILYAGIGIGPYLFSHTAAELGSNRAAFGAWSIVAAVTVCLFLLSARTPYRVESDH